MEGRIKLARSQGFLSNMTCIPATWWRFKPHISRCDIIIAIWQRKILHLTKFSGVRSWSVWLDVVNLCYNLGSVIYQLWGFKSSIFFYIILQSVLKCQFHQFFFIGQKNMVWGTSLVVQRLRICLAMQGMWVWSLVRKLRSHMLRGKYACTVHHNH